MIETTHPVQNAINRKDRADDVAVSAQTQVLVVVHPASACGSADFNLGDDEAASDRAKLITDLAGWVGGVIILDGGFSKELALPAYRPLQTALVSALSKAKSSQQIAIRRQARDPSQIKVMQQLIPQFDPAEIHFCLTGAWFHPDDGGGCVGSVLSVLLDAGFMATVQPSALRL